jgi:hypothetical protein
MILQPREDFHPSRYINNTNEKTQSSVFPPRFGRPILRAEERRGGRDHQGTSWGVRRLGGAAALRNYLQIARAADGSSASTWRGRKVLCSSSLPVNEPVGKTGGGCVRSCSRRIGFQGFRHVCGYVDFFLQPRLDTMWQGTVS